MLEFELSYYIPVSQWDGTGYSFDKNILEGKLQILQKAGVKWIGVEGINLMEPSDTDISYIIDVATELFNKYEISVTSIHYAGPVYNFLNQSQDKVKNHLQNYVNLFNVWKPKSFVIHASWIAGKNDTSDRTVARYLEEKAEHGEEALLQTIADNLKKMSYTANKYNIKLALENMGRFVPLGGVSTLPALIEMINEDNVGYCIDSGHAHAFGESVQKWLKVAGGKLFETHFHDNRSLGQNSTDEFVDPALGYDEHLPVGFGTISWIDVINTLKEISFKGPVTFETGGWPTDNPVESYQRAIQWWRCCEKLALKKNN